MTVDPQQFYQLTPDVMLEAIERAGWPCTGEYLQLNSFENRVFSVTLEEDPFSLIAKFYRPGRWSPEAIREEHEFLWELEDFGIPAVAPFKNRTVETEGIITAFFPKARGRIPADFSYKELESIGRLLARVHIVGAEKDADHRHVFDAQMGFRALQTLTPLIPSPYLERYVAAAGEILNFLDDRLENVGFQRIHGDCHRGNLLHTDEPGKPKEFFLLDFDDFGLGPVVQDFWMLCLGDELEAERQLTSLLTGYTELRDLDKKELELLEPLRGLRIIHYAAWIARRWSDPSFPQIFPQYATEAYWIDELQSLEPIADAL